MYNILAINLTKDALIIIIIISYISVTFLPRVALKMETALFAEFISR